MKIHVLAVCIVLLVLNGAGHVESRRHGRSDRRRRSYTLFVFGDSFADAGNRNPSHAWNYPYGSSDSGHGNRATGRFSDGLIQSDYLAKIMGHEEAPQPYRLRSAGANDGDSFGVTFAAAGSGVLDGSRQEAPSLSMQIDQFARLVNQGIIDDEDLDDDSVALVAISGFDDYGRITSSTSLDNIVSLSEEVTDEIVAGVRRLQELGVSKVLVNSVPPIGCQPFRSRNNSYDHCDSRGNMVATTHNTALKHKLDKLKHVLLLDLYTSFTNFVETTSPAGTDRLLQTGSTTTVSKLSFKHKFTPCCVNPDPHGYCGQEDGNGNPLYTLCSTPTNFFYWDYIHPTQAAWKAIMMRLQGPIEDFLGIEDSNW